MAEDVVVWILVGLVAVLIVRRFRRALTGDSTGCGCDAGACGQSKPCDRSEDATVERG